MQIKKRCFYLTNNYFQHTQSHQIVFNKNNCNKDLSILHVRKIHPSHMNNTCDWPRHCSCKRDVFYMHVK